MLQQGLIDVPHHAVGMGKQAGHQPKQQLAIWGNAGAPLAEGCRGPTNQQAAQQKQLTCASSTTSCFRGRRLKPYLASAGQEGAAND